MSDLKDESYEVIAKEITIELIIKCPLKVEETVDFACKTFDQVYKQIVNTASGK